MIHHDELNDFKDPRGEAYLVPRWTTYWYQFSAISKLEEVETILEVGPGRGILGALCSHFGYRHEAIDIVPNRNADNIGNINETKFPEKFDLTCAFQVLEHNEFPEAKKLIKSLCDNSKKYVFISLPVSKRWLGFNIDINVPGLRSYFLWGIDLGRLFLRKRNTDNYDRAQKFKYHWWELYESETGITDINKAFEANSFKLVQKNRVKTFRFHVGLLYEKQ